MNDDLDQEYVVLYPYLFMSHFTMPTHVANNWRNFKENSYGEALVTLANSIWWIGEWFAPLLKRTVWVSENSILLTKPS